MAIKSMSIDEFVAFMKERQGELTDRDYAQSIGVSPQYLCDVYNGRRVPGDSITSALGATREVIYRVEEKKEKR